MTLEIELFYQFTGIQPHTLAGLDGNLYVGTTNQFPNEGVKKIVSLAAPMSDSTLNGTDLINRPRYITTHNSLVWLAGPNESWNVIWWHHPDGPTSWTGNLSTASGNTWPGGYDFAFRPADGTCWVINSSRDLMMLDATGVWAGTGSALWTCTAASPYQMRGLVWENDVLYLADEHRIWTFDPVSDTFTLLVDLSALTTLNGIRGITAMSGRIWVVSETSVGSGDPAVISCALDGTDPRIDASETNFVWFPRSIKAVDGALYLGDASYNCVWKIGLPVTPPSWVDPGPSSVRSYQYWRS